MVDGEAAIAELRVNIAEDGVYSLFGLGLIPDLAVVYVIRNRVESLDNQSNRRGTGLLGCFAGDGLTPSPVEYQSEIALRVQLPCVLITHEIDRRLPAADVRTHRLRGRNHHGVLRDPGVPRTQSR